MESIFFFSFFFIAIIESIVSARWNPTYYKVGIPIYSNAYTYDGTAPAPIGEVALNEAFQKRKYDEVGKFAFEWNSGD